jgi:hypothetical protein
MRRKTLALALCMLMLFAIGLFIAPETTPLDSTPNSRDFNLSINDEKNVGQQSGIQAFGLGGNVSAEHVDIINEDQPLKIWVKLDKKLDNFTYAHQTR